MVLTTRGAGVHFAPFGSAGIEIVHFSASATNIEKAIDLPSGDQRALRGVSVRWVICVAGPSASTWRTKICDPFGSPSARYISRLPSDDQRGADPLTRNRCCDPSALRIHRLDSHLSSSRFTYWRAYTMRDPSGEIWASLTRSQSSQCSVVSSVSDFVSCARSAAPPASAAQIAAIANLRVLAIVVLPFAIPLT